MMDSLEEPLRDTRTLVIQLRDRIATLIRDQALPPGSKLPTEAQLTARFKISRPALREALKLLEQDGTITVEHGRGRFISAMSAVQVDRPITVFESVTDMAGHYGYKPVNRVLAIREEAADAVTAEKLRLGPDDKVIRIERLRLHGKEPIMYCVDFVPRSLFQDEISGIDWSGSLLDLLESGKQRPRMSAASVSAVTLPPEIIERHQLQDFGPALLISETCYNAFGLPVIYAIDYHRGSHFTFSLIRR
ncbi:MAG: GntR family transcriptional regulator [Rhizobium sp.]|nr:GntR family transcriptional regulator [Rhizobium sp.]